MFGSREATDYSEPEHLGRPVTIVSIWPSASRGRIYTDLRACGSITAGCQGVLRLPQSTAKSNALRVRFGPFELDEANSCLLRDGKALSLPPTPFAVLCMLAR